MNFRSLALAAAIASLPVLANAEPPGALNPEVTQSNIRQTICVPGWTQTVRPPVTYTTKLKIQQLRSQGLRGSASDYEEDHMIPLALGGHPTDPNNLWPEPWNGSDGARVKDVLETTLHRLVCRGALSLEAARAAIANDWHAAYEKYVGPLPR